MDGERKNCIIIDWLTFSHKLFTVQDAIEVLGLAGESWVDECGSNYRYEKRKTFMHMTIHYTEKNHSAFVPGVCVEMSGQGCREFEEFSSISWCDLLTWLHDESQHEIKIAPSGSTYVDCLHYDHVNQIRTVKVAQISRLDLAYDDFEGKLDINVMASETRAFNYTTILKRHKIIEDSETANPDHVGLSVCFGSKSSNVYFRFYDKRVERERWDLPHWIRAEIQLRAAAAVGALDCICSGMPIGELHANICNRYIQYKIPGNDTHKDRWNTAQWWFEFLGSVSEICLFTRKDVEYNKKRMDHYAYKQNHNHTLCELVCDGLGEYLLRLLDYRDAVPEKYLKVAQMCSRNGAELAELLRDLPKMSKSDFLLMFSGQLNEAAKAEADAAEYRRIFGFIDP